MHEIAHCDLKHRSIRKEEGYSFFLHSYDQTQEEEAAWLGGCLQIPRAGLQWALRQGMDDATIAQWFRASRKMVIFRSSMTGINCQFGR